MARAGFKAKGRLAAAYLLQEYLHKQNKQQAIMAKETKYEAAMSPLEEIVRKMENGDLDVDSLCGQLKTAQKLIKLCKDKLTKTDEEIRKILDAE